jgi:hypothetical protein
MHDNPALKRSNCRAEKALLRPQPSALELAVALVLELCPFRLRESINLRERVVQQIENRVPP